MKQQVPQPVVIGLILTALVIAGFFVYKAMQPPDVTAALKAKAEYARRNNPGGQVNRFERLRAQSGQGNTSATPGR